MKSMGNIAVIMLVFSLTVFYGCAGTAPTAEFKKPISDIHRLCSADEATVKLVASNNVVLSDITRQRLESLLQQKINEKKDAAQCQSTDKRAFILDSKITLYDEGNAFARAMLAGLGSINIFGDFVLSLMPVKNESIAEFTVQKTFAWGGVYGASNHIEDVEPAFAEGVAEAIVAKATEKKGSENKVGRFIANDNGTVLDTKTNLMWAAKDNGADINWQSAKSYCENYRGGGYTDWRMPTQNELAGLYGTANIYQSECRSNFGFTSDMHLTELIHLTCYYVWASEKSSSDANFFYFVDGQRGLDRQSADSKLRALPVRSGK